MMQGLPTQTLLKRREHRLWTSLIIVVALILSTIWTSGTFPPSALPYLFATFGLALSTISGLLAHSGSRDDRALAIAFRLALGLIVLMMPMRLVSTAERSHLIEYSAVAVLLRDALRMHGLRGRAVPRPTLITLVVVVLIGLFDEILQETVATRHFDWRDVFINLCAAVLGLVFYHLSRFAAGKWWPMSQDEDIGSKVGTSKPPTR